MRSIFVFIFLASAFAADVPELSGPVVDKAGLLKNFEYNEISQQLYSYNQKSSHQIQVLIIPSLEGEPIENYSIKVSEKWKLGDAKRDDGILLLIATQDRQFRIEVGQGLEGALPDATANRIGRSILTPAFKEGQFGVGIAQALRAIAGQLDQDLTLDVPQRRSTGGRLQDKLYWFIIFFFIIITVLRAILFPFFPRRWRRTFGSGGGWGGYGGGSWGGGGSFGGGGWSGGGGGFSGGGASGRW